jgi:VanZ family protein
MRVNPRWWPVVGWAGVILLITSWPNPPVPSGLPPWTDKLVHLTIYGVLGMLVARATVVQWRVLALLAACAAADEWHQRLVPGRGPDLADWVADTVGATAGLLLGARRARPAFSSQ